ncbi:MAG: PAS domain S-box protein, partial [Nitrospinales bacterium]
MEREVKNNLSAQLQTALDANAVALKLWIETKRSDSRVWSYEPTVRKSILSLVEKTSHGNWPSEKLFQTPELKRLRQYLGPVCKQYSYIGFVLMDRTGLQIAALLDEPIGQRMLIGRSDFVKRSLNGETLVSLPFPGEVALPDIEGEWRTDHPTMFVSTPVRDEAGNIVAVFSFRIRPETEFSRILETSRTGRTGETYAFDATGTMISDSRFSDQLKEMGLLPDRPNTHSIMNIHLRDPSQKHAPANVQAILPREQRPQTKMAASATRGESGLDVNGYKDYRGIPVIGAWTWLPQYGFGLATEIDVEEAFKPLHTLKTGFILFFGLLTVSFVVSWGLRGRQLYLEDQGTQAEKARRESDVRVRSVVATAIDGIITIDVNGVVESFNPAAERLFQYSAEEVIGENVSMLMPEPYQSQHDNYLEKYLRTGVAAVIGVEREVLGRRKDGTTFPMELSVSEMNLEERRLFVGIARDITERKQSEKELKHLHKKNQMILNSAAEGILGFDEKEKIVFINPAASKLLGYSAQELIGQPMHNLIQHTRGDGSPYPREKSPNYKCLKMGLAYHIEDEMFWRKDGASFPVEYSCNPITVDNGRIAGTVVTFMDITERKRAEELMTRFGRILDDSFNEIYIFEAESLRFVQVNFGARKNLGYTMEEMSRLTPLDLKTEFTAEEFNKLIAPLYQGTKSMVVFETVHKRKDGTLYPVEIRLQLSRKEKPSLFVAIVQDITERHRAEEDLKRYAHELEITNQELKDFAHIASHDLQEPLRKVIAFGDRLRTTYADNLDKRGKDYIERMQNATHRMRQLIDDLLLFSGINVKEVCYEPVDLNQVVREVLTDLDFRIEETRGKVDVKTLPTIEVDAVQMRQLFQNLISNALKFHRNNAPPEITISSRNSESGKWEILVEDNGIGFEDKYLDRMFKPFQRLTTNKSFNGSGIGLAIRQRIVTRHHGDITAFGQPEQGSKFIITLPE